MVDARDVLVLAYGRRRSRSPVVDPRLVGIWRGHEAIQEFLRVPGDAARRNHVPGKRLVGQRIVNGRLNSRKISGAQRHRRQQRLPAEGPRHLPPGFPVEEEKRLVLAVVKSRQPYRPAQVGPELVAVQPRRLGARNVRLERVERGERVVTVELPRRAVHPVSAALGREVHLPAGRSAHFRRIRAALNLELVDGVDRGRKAEAVAVEVHGLDAVVIEPVLRVARPVRRHADRLSDRPAQPTHRDAARRPGIHSRRQQRELHERPAVQRQLHDLLAVDDGPHRGILGLHQHRAGLHLDGLGRLPHHHADVHARHLVHIQDELAHLGFLKTRRLH